MTDGVAICIDGNLTDIASTNFLWTGVVPDTLMNCEPVNQHSKAGANDNFGIPPHLCKAQRISRVTATGTISEVTRAFRLIATPANTPATVST